MESVLQKTVASLERALRYNPENVELMVSLAEGYVRMGRLDSATIALCEKVLAKYPESPLIQQAQTVSFVIEQAEAIDAGLAAGKAPPQPDDIRSSADILREFLGEVGDSTSVWLAWTRLCLLAGFMEQVLDGLKRLKALRFEKWSTLKRSLDWVSKNPPGDHVNWEALYEVYATLGEAGIGQRALESAFDRGFGQKEIGPPLLKLYLKRYTHSNPGAVPETIRPRLFQLLLDYGEPALAGEWLRKASLFGWEVNSFSKLYAKDLIEQGQLEGAFEMLQRMGMDGETRDLMNTISLEYEKRDQVDDAVRILRYINSHEIVEAEAHQQKEAEIAREMELSLAELHLKNGRVPEALTKFVSALCLADELDLAVLERIEEIIHGMPMADPVDLLRLAAYFRARQDHPKTISYLNHILDTDPNHTEALQELQSLLDQIVAENPDSPELRLELGRVHQKMGRPAEAIEELKKASASPEVGPRANRMLAEIYLETGQNSEALGRLQAMNSEDEADLELLYKLHVKFVEAEDVRSALMALDMISRVKADFRDVNTRIRYLNEKSSPSQSTPANDVKMRELIGDLSVGRYRYLEKIGSGGMGVVHKVVDLRQQKVVAMKILRDGLGGSSKALDRFFREARIAASIHHRNIVEIFDYNISSLNGNSYISMEFVDGPSLREFIDKHYEQTISISVDYVTEMLYYTAQLLDALDATHTKGIIHRDIKPDNIMINAVGEVKITDFGIVHVEEATFTPTGAMLGTPRYMSPEQVTGGKIDGRSDIYSTGILLYEVLTGSPPFMTGDVAYQQVNKKPVEPRSVNPIIPVSVNEYIMKCLEKPPDDRFPNAKEAKAALTTILDSLGGCKKYEAMTAVRNDEPANHAAIPEAAMPISSGTDPRGAAARPSSQSGYGSSSQSSYVTPAKNGSQHDSELDLPDDLDPDLDLG